MITFKKAERKATPVKMSIAGEAGAGKTMGALLIAAGLANGGKVAILDTENGRGAMYADHPAIEAVYPEGYLTFEMDAPHSPERYMQKIKAAEKEGISVLIIDSATHEWEGEGGVCEIAEKHKQKWIKAKREHRTFFMDQLRDTRMHTICCLRGREKKVQGATQHELISLGWQPVQEGNFINAMTVSITLDPETRRPSYRKGGEAKDIDLSSIEGELLSPEIGMKLREWVGSAPKKIDFDLEEKKAEARQIATGGYEVFLAWYKELASQLPATQKAELKRFANDECKAIAEEADALKEGHVCENQSAFVQQATNNESAV